MADGGHKSRPKKACNLSVQIHQLSVICLYSYVSSLHHRQKHHTLELTPSLSVSCRGRRIPPRLTRCLLILSDYPGITRSSASPTGSCTKRLLTHYIRLFTSSFLPPSSHESIANESNFGHCSRIRGLYVHRTPFRRHGIPRTRHLESSLLSRAPPQRSRPARNLHP